MNEKTDRKEYMKKWQQDNKEKTRENAKRYYYKNIDKIKEKRQSNEYKENKREWARENRKKQKEIINNLQSKIDKAIAWIEQYEKQIGTLGETSKSIVLTDDVVIGNLLDILKEMK